MHKTRVLNPLPSAIIPIPDIRIGVISLRRETCMPYSSYFLRSDLFKRALLEGEIPELQIRGREGKNLLVKRLEKMRALRRSARWNDH